MHFDVVIVGAGPAGLSLAITLASQGCLVAVIEKQSMRALSEPAFDGREIALTEESRMLLRDMGAWKLLPDEEMFPLRTARVLNGGARTQLSLRSARPGQDRLATLVSNVRIRSALFEIASHSSGIRFFAGEEVTEFARRDKAVTLKLASGVSLSAKLLVAADSRLSGIRKRMGIAAQMRRLGQSMLIFRVEHDAAHGQSATEWFAHRHTIAALPLGDRVSSLVITMPEGDIAGLMHLSEEGLAREAERLSGHQFGKLRIASSRHVYPLVMTYARRFVCARGALVGDAAVGMHPVTAHGFNFGLKGQGILAEEIHRAARHGCDIGTATPLLAYERRHRRVTRPLYLATDALVRLYTNESHAGHRARETLLHAAGRLPLVAQAVSAMLFDGASRH